ncbi:MAG: hypothetical protein ACKO7W_17795 [Elainella sp.]
MPTSWENNFHKTYNLYVSKIESPGAVCQDTYCLNVLLSWLEFDAIQPLTLSHARDARKLARKLARKNAHKNARKINQG